MAYVQLSGYTACKVLLTASSEVKVSSPADDELNVHHDVKKMCSVHSAIYEEAKMNNTFQIRHHKIKALVMVTNQKSQYTDTLSIYKRQA